MQTGLTILWKSIISWCYRFTADDDKLLFSFPFSLPKGAFWYAYLYLSINLLINRKINYKVVFLFSHRTLRMRKLIDRKNTDRFPLWRERATKSRKLRLLFRKNGRTILGAVWASAHLYMLARRKACWCTFDLYTVLLKMLSGSLRLVSNGYYFVRL